MRRHASRRSGWLPARPCQTGCSQRSEVGCRARYAGIELDIAMAAQYVIFAGDQARLVSPLPQAPGAVMTGIEGADVVSAESLHRTANVAGVLRCHEEVDMVVHQDVGMQAAVRCGQRLPQELQVAQSIAIFKEAGQAVVAALHHLLGCREGRDGGGVPCLWAYPRGWLVAVLATPLRTPDIAVKRCRKSSPGPVRGPVRRNRRRANPTACAPPGGACSRAALFHRESLPGG